MQTISSSIQQKGMSMESWKMTQIDEKASENINLVSVRMASIQKSALMF